MLISGNILQERYQLQKQLGRTAAGRQTWLSTDLHTQEQVTVKLLAFSPQMEWEELKLFEREAEVLQSLDHPRIPRYRDYFSIDRETGSGLPWFGLVQDYIPGSSLQELIENGKRFTESDVKNIAKNVLEILIYLHQLSPPVLHRDIKPSNLIYGKDKQIYLIDFGAVQAQAHVTGVTFTVVGTSGYAPLEQFWGRAVAASDLYALGATLIHLLTGITPADLPQKESRILFSDRVSISPHLISWLETMTEIAVEKRFQTAKVALECFLSTKNQHSIHSQPAKIRKIAQPEYSKIKLSKSRYFLKIYFPAQGFMELDCQEMIRFLAPIPFFLILILTNPFLLLILSIVMLILLAIRINLCNEKIYVNLSHNKIETKRKSFGLSDRVEYANISDFSGVFVKEIKSNHYAVMIRSGTKTHQIGRGLTEEESLWLILEIQDWLNSK
ncbi:serine/threonine protein kinase [Limnoraphis robusta]|uniref:Protein kinase domain-containing protein n=1 Tax=Limnoraphis robusta CS-951 TaxID=1637645 RepID=A0A0F5Y880_9CYAN|nr:serine/threonine-protein kinase [Limnoraphis robusta]KKD34842.1 hypothetical protein WN50_28605 [Limnoraphis robusta CS-951]